MTALLVTAHGLRHEAHTMRFAECHATLGVGPGFAGAIPLDLRQEVIWTWLGRRSLDQPGGCGNGACKGELVGGSSHQWGTIDGGDRRHRYYSRYSCSPRLATFYWCWVMRQEACVRQKRGATQWSGTVRPRRTPPSEHLDDDVRRGGHRNGSAKAEAWRQPPQVSGSQIARSKGEQ